MKKDMKGYVKASRKPLIWVTALITAIAVLGAVTAFAATGESYIVDVYEGSQITRVETSKRDAYAIVADADVVLSENDKLLLDDFRAGEQSKITVCRYSNVVFVNGDGVRSELSFAGTVGELISTQGITLSDKLISSVGTDKVVEDGMEISILNSYDVTVNCDNEKRLVKSTAVTVADLLSEQNIVLGENDEVDPSADISVTNGMTVNVFRVEYVTRTVEEKIPFESKKVNSSALSKGTTKVTQQGADGTKLVVYKDKVVNGQVVSSEVQSEKVIKKAVDQITAVGTLVQSSSSGLGNNKIQKNAKPISEIALPSKYSIGENNVPTNYKYTITGKAAAYCMPGGITSTGKKVKPGYIAVNPKQIPYGTEMWIVSNDGVVYGYAIAADTGGFANKGTFTVDLYMNSKNQCYQWGARNVTIYVL